MIRQRLAGRVLEVRHDEEHPRGEPVAAQDARRFGDVKAFAIDGHLDDLRAVVAERGQRVRERRRLGDDDVAWPQVDPAREIDRLERAGADEDLLGIRIDTTRARVGGDRGAELGLALRHGVAERAGALAADHGRGEVVRSDQLERLAGRGADRERNGVARLPRDDADRLVDERAEDLVQTLSFAGRQLCRHVTPSMSAMSHE